MGISKFEINSELSVQAQQDGGVNVMMGNDESTATLKLNNPSTARLFAMALLTAAEEADAFLRAAE